MSPGHYFADDFCKLCTEGLQSCKDTEQFIKLCQGCGAELATEEAANDRQGNFLAAFKRNFFPEMP